jgi:WhiB family redox-sensing transcriptional regulator
VQEPYGIWGGLSEDDRAAILMRRGIPLISTAS